VYTLYRKLKKAREFVQKILSQSFRERKKWAKKEKKREEKRLIGNGTRTPFGNRDEQ